ncbi:MAG: AAA family ATPase [Planctomycetes bacterium]|nr:AAA family ATPase [Planctomycetota bacterium]
MHHREFGLDRPPFDDQTDAQRAFTTPEADEILAAGQYAARFGGGMMLVLAEAGAGKTVLLHRLVSALGADDQTVVVTCPSGAELDLLRETCRGFGVTLPASYQRHRALERLTRQLTATAKAKRRSALLIDQAEHLTDDGLAVLEVLANSCPGGRGLLAVVLFAQPQLRQRLEAAEHARLRQHLFPAHLLPPLSSAQTVEYIRHRLRLAGGESALFDDAAFEPIHAAAAGIPRLIHRIADAAMLVAYGAGERRVGRDTVLEVTRRGVLQERSAPLSHVALASTTALVRGLEKTAPSPPQPSTPSPVPPASIPDRRANVAGRAPSSASDVEPGRIVPAGVDPSGGYSPNTRLHDREVMVSIAGLSDPQHVAWVPPPATPPPPPTMPAVAPPGEAQDLVARLEQALGRADELCRTLGAEPGGLGTGAIAPQQHDLPTASAALAGLHDAMDQFVPRLESRIEALIADAEERVRALESRAERAAAWTSAAGDPLERLEQACEQARSAESRLSGFTEELVRRVDTIQVRCAEFSGVIERGEHLEQRLTRATDSAARESQESEGRMATLERRVAHEAARAEEQARALQRCQEASAAGQRQLKTLLEIAATAHQDTVARVESQHAAFRQMVGQLRQELEQAGHAARQAFCDDAARTVATSAGALDTALETFAHRQRELADTAIADLQARLDAEGTRHRQALGASEADAAKVREAASSAVAQARVALERLVQEYRDAAEAVSAKLAAERKATEAAGAAQRQVTLSHVKEVREQTATAVADARRELAATVEGHRDAVATLFEAATTQRTTLQREITADRAQVSAIAAAWEQTHAQRVAEMRDDAAQLQAQLEAAEKQQHTLQGAVEESEQRTRASVSRVESLAERLGGLSTVVEQLAQRAESARVPLAGAVERSDGLLQAVQEAAGRLEGLQHNVSASLVEIGSHYSQLAALRDQTQRGEQTVSRLVGADHAAQKRVRQLAEIIEAAGRSRQAAKRWVADAQSELGRLAAQRAAAGELMQRLAEAIVEARVAADRVSATSAAGVQSASEVGRRIGRLAEELSPLMETTQQRAACLAAACGTAEDWSARLRNLLEQAEAAAEPLAGHADRAQSLSAELAARNEAAGDALERLRSAAGIVEAAERTCGRIADSLDEGRTTYETLSAASDAAAVQRSRLEHLSAAAQELIANQTQLHQDMQAAGRELADRTQAAQAVEDQGRTLVTELAARLAELAKTVPALEQRAGQLEQMLSRTLARPGEIVAAAQAQATQLARVCSAVRKVFAGLSQAGLDARKLTQASEAKSAEAARHMTQLAAETHRASAALHQWVQEAVRVQTRLEATLQECPSVRQTHPAEALQALSRLAQPVRAGAPAGAGELAVLPDPRPRALTGDRRDGGDPKVTGPATRAAEIAALIEDAKRAADEVPTYPAMETMPAGAA